MLDAAVLVERTAGSSGGADPIASFTATSLQGDAPLTVRVDASASADDGTIVSYAWSFGDGAQDQGVTAQHTYTDAGSYVLTLVVTDDDGGEDTATRSVVVRDPSAPPPEGPGNSAHPGQILFSTRSDRAQAQALQDASVSGDIFVFLPADPSADIAAVHFFVDDPARSGPPVQTERVAPYDLGGGSVDRAWNALDTDALSNGVHRVDVDCELDDGSVVPIAASFSVGSSGPAGEPPPPDPDPTPIPEPHPGIASAAALAALWAWAGLLRRRRQSGGPL